MAEPRKISSFDPTLVEPKWSTYIPYLPTTRQQMFLLLNGEEALFGGAAGGGKSVALLMAALQYVDVPGYSALLLRRTYQDLSQPRALMDLSKEWLSPTDARWSEAKKQWRFPSNATLSFGYLESENDKYQYQSAAYNFIGFDELTQFLETQYTYLFSRLRRLVTQNVPLRMRAASNPGGVGHDWVKKRFVDTKTRHPGSVFIKSLLDDNPHLDRESYNRTLQNLDSVTRRQLRLGDWTARGATSMFSRMWFPVVNGYTKEHCDHLRYWDTAATRGAGDYSCGTKVARDRRTGQVYVVDVERFRESPGKVELRMLQTAILDGYGTTIYIQEEPGSAGKGWVSSIARHTLSGFEVRGDPNTPTKSKAAKAKPLSAAAESGHVSVVAGAWNEDFFDELELFTENPEDYETDDQVDATAGAFNKITRKAHQLVHHQPGARIHAGQLYGR